MPPKKRKSAPKSKTPKKSKRQQKEDENVQEELEIENKNQINDEEINDEANESNETKSEMIVENSDISIKRSHTQNLRVHEIVSDPLTQTSLEYWAPNSPKDLKPFDKDLIIKIYKEEIVEKEYNLSRIMLLELSYYLENYLWKYFDYNESSLYHILSIILMVNEKFRENVSAWDCFRSDQEKFNQLFDAILSLQHRDELSIKERTIYIQFLINCFQSLSEDLVRTNCLKIISLPIWKHVDESLRNRIFDRQPRLLKAWKKLQTRKNKKGKSTTGDTYSHEEDFIHELVQSYFKILEELDPSSNKLDVMHSIRFCEKFIEFIIDLLTQLPTRRFFRTYVHNCHLIVISRNSNLSKHEKGSLFNQLLDILKFYENFEINDFTGTALTENDIILEHYEKIQRMQRIAFKSFQKDFKNFALANVASIDTRKNIENWLSRIKDDKLIEFCRAINVIKDSETLPRNILMDILVSEYEKRKSHLDTINNSSIYPDEKFIWDNNQVDNFYFTGDETLPLPKLNLQFLTLHDHLLRNYTLYRLESAYEIKESLEQSIRRMQPCLTTAKTTRFKGWSRMAVPIQGFKIINIGKPELGEEKPSFVTAEVSYKLPTKNKEITEEWESLRPHDVLFFLTIKATRYEDDIIDESEENFRKLYGVEYLRCGEILEILDNQGNPIDYDKPNPDDPQGKRGIGLMRTIKLALDTSQYQMDLETILKEGKTGTLTEELYGTFNLMVRRKSKENNFKAVLETIRALMNTRNAVPEWLDDVFLGYGDPSSCTNVEIMESCDFVDTFVSLDHLKSSLSNYNVKINETKVNVNDHTNTFFKIKRGENNNLEVTPYKKPINSPYESEITPKRNMIEFTSVQVEAIMKSMNKGLNLIVGPPGTGKTDIAVQIISNWFHNFPNEKILIVTHSNNALNQIFEKIMALDIDERYLLRLGHGGEYLETNKDFSKNGRVNYLLQLRLDLLQLVARLAMAISKPTDVAYSCETAENFFKFDVTNRWLKYLANIEKLEEKKASDVINLFPFTKFFFDAPQPLFDPESTFDEAFEKSLICFNFLKGIFEKLQECRPLELLRKQYDRGNYLVTKQARIVAMTCTHASLKRNELVNIGFKYDNILMEEAAQVLEIETVIPMFLQETDPEAPSRLKRVVLIGDHNQLPPVVQNMSYQKFGHLDQSLFTRFIRLSVPHITLDAQGRARPSLSNLYKWKYDGLVDLDVVKKDQYLLGNPGFLYDYQLIDVPDFHGIGESMPTPHFYQNLGEAEYVVAVFMYMRLLGYPKEKISIITTYNGQKMLIRDVLQQRCGDDKFFGKPHKITTVDRFQGQQNDYILLSLVRTKTVGHIRDVRRLIVAMSRARLGLYVFCRKDLFKDCYELAPTFSYLLKRPSNLMLVKDEKYEPFERKLEEEVPDDKILKVENLLHMGQIIS